MDFLTKASDNRIFDSLSKYGQEGVEALAAATPADSGLTASSWSFEILKDSTSWSIVWSNSHMDDNGATPVAILIQLGHGTGTGGYVAGRDFINPALRPVFDRIEAEAMKVVMQ
jgi:hypothetical protein